MDTTLEQRAAARGGVVDFRDPALREQTMKVLRQVQEDESIPRLKGLRSYLVTSHSDCEAILSSMEFGFEDIGPQLNEAKPRLANYFAMRRGLMLFQNQPRHKESRDEARQVLAAWSAPEIKDLAREELHQVLDELKAQDTPQWDFIALVARPFVERVAARLLGLPVELVAEVAVVTQEVAATLDPLGAVNSLEDSGNHYQHLEDLVSECLKDLEVPSGCPYHHRPSAPVGAMLISASVFTTTHLLGLVMHSLLSDPDLRLAVTEEKAIPGTAVEELLRYHSPARMTRRVARERVRIRDQAFEKGTVFWLALGAANRDSRVFPHPDELLLNRSPNRHLAFGKGAHQCLGAQLARLQLQVFLEEFPKAFPLLRWSPESTTPLQSLIFSGFKSLGVKS